MPLTIASRIKKSQIICCIFISNFCWMPDAGRLMFGNSEIILNLILKNIHHQTSNILLYKLNFSILLYNAALDNPKSSAAKEIFPRCFFKAFLMRISSISSMLRLLTLSC